jgi:fermentation-respiration switch protein FrsA (DUF1100 family)
MKTNVSFIGHERNASIFYRKEIRVMKIIISILSLVVVVSTGFFFSYAQEQKVSDSADLKSLAYEFVEFLTKEDFSRATENFDNTMKTALPVDKLQGIWKSLITQVGSFKKQGSVRTEQSGQYHVVYVTCEFETSALDVKIVFNTAKQIAGLFFVPSQSASEYKSPSYVKFNAFREIEVTVGNGEWTLPGTITFPIGDGPFPAVVLVHGSGPQDRDESIGPNKVFRDLAWGLASREIAVLRYEKRTKAQAVKLLPLKDAITVKEETIDDVLAAVYLLRKTEGIDIRKIFVLGHSLGGMLIPRIGILDSSIGGFIIMAGTTRPLEDVVLDQMSYIFSLDGAISENEKAQLEAIKTQIARVKDPKLSVSTPSKDLPLGIPSRYWLALRGYNPPEMAKDLKQPTLIIQGERDYQVTMEDFQGWKNALSSRSNVVYKTYPKLNHLFIEGDSKSVPSEYQVAGHVAEVIIDDIARWIKK